MLEKLKNTLDRGIATVSVKSESVVETSRIRAQLLSLQKQRADKVSQLGGEVYEMWNGGVENRERVEQLCGEIRGIERTIDEQDRRLAQVRAEEQQRLGGQPAAQPDVFCPACGAKNQAGARFCVSCGNRLSE